MSQVIEWIAKGFAADLKKSLTSIKEKTLSIEVNSSSVHLKRNDSWIVIFSFQSDHLEIHLNTVPTKDIPYSELSMFSFQLGSLKNLIRDGDKSYKDLVQRSTVLHEYFKNK